MVSCQYDICVFICDGRIFYSGKYTHFGEGGEFHECLRNCLPYSNKTKAQTFLPHG